MNPQVAGGKKGGRRRAQALSPRKRSAIAKKAAVARWADASGKGVFSITQIRKATKPLEEFQPLQIILFGSYGRGKPRRGSDVDLMIIRKEKFRTVAEYAREQRRFLDALKLDPVDLLMVDEATWNEWKNEFGSVYYDAAHDGKVLYSHV